MKCEVLVKSKNKARKIELEEEQQRNQHRQQQQRNQQNENENVDLMDIDEETTLSKVTEMSDAKKIQSIQTMRSEVSQLTHEMRSFSQKQEQSEKDRIRRGTTKEPTPTTTTKEPTK